MNPASAIAKGKALEDFVVDRLRASGLDPRAYRQKGSGSGINKGDVWNDLGLCFECKNTKTLAITAAWAQAEREAMGTQRPLVVWHPPRQPIESSLVILEWDHFEELLLKAREPKTAARTESREDQYRVSRLIQAAKDVLKMFERE